MPVTSRKPRLTHAFLPAAGTPSRRAFTLIELLLVIATIAILAALLFPVFSSARARGQEAGCIDNLKQLVACVLVYADDNGSKFPDNLPLDSQPATTNNWALGNMMISTQATNAVPLKRGELFPYTTQSTLYHCPSDPSQTNGTPRVRSYSMNGWIGSRAMNTTYQETGYRTFVMENETTLMGAANLWVIGDESELSIDDPWWLVTMDNSQPFVSFPATRHSRGFNLSFADGHVERWILRDPKTISPLFISQITSQNSDWNRLKQASTTSSGIQPY